MIIIIKNHKGKISIEFLESAKKISTEFLESAKKNRTLQNTRCGQKPSWNQLECRMVWHFQNVPEKGTGNKLNPDWCKIRCFYSRKFLQDDFH